MADLIKRDSALKGYDTVLSILDSAVNAVSEAKAIVLQYGSEPAQQWIPCSERLPEKEDVYLVTFDKKCLLENEADVSDMYWVDGKWQYAMIEHYEHKMPKLIVEPIEELKVVAWMPLPKAYQEGEDNERA